MNNETTHNRRRPHSNRPGRRAGSHAQACRAIRLHRKLVRAREPLPFEALASELQVSPRQLRRDCEALDASGTPVRFVRVAGRTAICLEHVVRDPIHLTVSEIFSLAASRSICSGFVGTPIADDLDAVAAKLGLAAGRLDRCFTRVPSRSVGTQIDPDVFDDLISGLLRGMRVDIAHLDTDGVVLRGRLAPWVIAVFDGALFVVGDLTDLGAVAVRLDRITSSDRVRSDRFEPPDQAEVARQIARLF